MTLYASGGDSGGQDRRGAERKQKIFVLLTLGTGRRLEPRPTPRTGSPSVPPPPTPVKWKPPAPQSSPRGSAVPAGPAPPARRLTLLSCWWISCFSSDAFSGGSDMLGSPSVAPAAAASPWRSQSPRPLASRAPGAAASGRRGNREAPTAVSKRRLGCPRAACQSPRLAPLLGPARRLRAVPASPFPRAAPAATPARSPSRAPPRQAVGRAPKDRNPGLEGPQEPSTRTSGRRLFVPPAKPCSSPPGTRSPTSRGAPS